MDFEEKSKNNLELWSKFRQTYAHGKECLKKTKQNYVLLKEVATHPEELVDFFRENPEIWGEMLPEDRTTLIYTLWWDMGNPETVFKLPLKRIDIINSWSTIIQVLIINKNFEKEYPELLKKIMEFLFPSERKILESIIESMKKENFDSSDIPFYQFYD